MAFLCNRNGLLLKSILNNIKKIKIMNNTALNSSVKRVYKSPILMIDKEELVKVKFSPSEVLEDVTKKSERKKKLQRALKLGNNYKTHVRLTLKSKFHKVFQTEATVWAVTEKYVTLKGGINVPINSIVSVDFH